MTPERELELIRKIETDFRALEELYDHYFPQIKMYVQNRVVDNEVANSISATVFERMVSNWEKFKYRKGVKYSLKGWLHLIAHDLVLSHFRSRSDTEGSKNVESLAIDINSPDYSPARSELAVKIRSVLSSMKPHYQLILSLKFYTDLTNNEICDTLGLNEKKMQSMTNRALSSFQKRFSNRFSDVETF